MFSGRGGLDMAPIEERGALWRYHPRESQWELIEPSDQNAPYPPGRSYHASASDGIENVFIHAGCPERGRLSDLWSFNIRTKTWTELEGAPSPPRGGTSLAAHGGKLYRMNGFDGTTDQGGAIDIYDIATRSWSTFSFSPDGVHGPTPRSVSALLVVRISGRDHIVTLFGEGDPSALGHAGAGKMMDDVWAFDLASKGWRKAAPISGQLPAARGWFDADVTGRDADQQRVIVHGGLTEDNTRLGDVWKLELKLT
ncbi:kelch repeat protein [Pestalotiopsis sp. NC0098]|nr:kelch repeat protein [Pestalotiopsis sp. NC0098]